MPHIAIFHASFAPNKEGNCNWVEFIALNIPVESKEFQRYIYNTLCGSPIALENTLFETNQNFFKVYCVDSKYTSSIFCINRLSRCLLKFGFPTMRVYGSVICVFETMAQKLLVFNFLNDDPFKTWRNMDLSITAIRKYSKGVATRVIPSASNSVPISVPTSTSTKIRIPKKSISTTKDKNQLQKQSQSQASYKQPRRQVGSKCLVVIRSKVKTIDEDNVATKVKKHKHI